LLILKDAGEVKGCVGLKKVMYEEGVEVPYDGQGSYALSISFIAFSRDCPGDIALQSTQKNNGICYFTS